VCILFLCCVLWIGYAIAQESCSEFTSCDKCTDMLCTWCVPTKSCVRVNDPTCTNTDPYCVTQGKEHMWLIGISVAVNVIMIIAMVASVKIFYFPRRSRILARHARRTTFTVLPFLLHVSHLTHYTGREFVYKPERHQRNTGDD